jgi:hypothetical protein
VTLLRCPACRYIWVDDPERVATEEDGTGVTDDLCFTCAELEAGIADDYY